MVWQPAHWATPPSWKAMAEPASPRVARTTAITTNPNVKVFINSSSFFLRQPSHPLTAEDLSALRPHLSMGLPFTDDHFQHVSKTNNLFRLIETFFITSPFYEKN
jgi:hypothetical protein